MVILKSITAISHNKPTTLNNIGVNIAVKKIQNTLNGFSFQLDNAFIATYANIISILDNTITIINCANCMSLNIINHLVIDYINVLIHSTSIVVLHMPKHSTDLRSLVYVIVLS